MISIKSIFYEISKHKKVLILANLVAILSTMLTIPVPLLIPLLIDEIILGKGGTITQTIDQYITIGSPEYYILTVLLLTLFFKGLSLMIKSYTESFAYSSFY